VDTCQKTTPKAEQGRMDANPVIFQSKMTGLESLTMVFSYTLGLR
tara:strand:- start:342 stop:476 length:135 start_codon:yes stop_codon:yes gene_type:complete